MTASIDITGQRFGKLVAVRPDGARAGHSHWWVQCDCGNEKSIRTSHLRQSGVSSCSPKCGAGMRRHGLSHTRIWEVWKSMKQRCNNPRFIAYHRYGGRGITYVPEWETFEPFAEWALANGYSDQLELDREDNDMGYSPGNCRFVTHAVNTANRAVTIRIAARGRTRTIGEWAEETGLAPATIRCRFMRGWPAERCVAPLVPKRKTA